MHELKRRAQKESSKIEHKMTALKERSVLQLNGRAQKGEIKRGDQKERSKEEIKRRAQRER